MAVPMMGGTSGSGLTRGGHGSMPGVVEEGGEEDMETGEEVEEETVVTRGTGTGGGAGAGLTPGTGGGRGAGVTPEEGGTGVGARTGQDQGAEAE